MATIESLELRLNETLLSIKTTNANIDSLFLIVNAIIVYFMQCGFAFLECGAVRAKNATNILMKNMLDSFIGAIAYWIIGWALAHGNGNGFIGTEYFVHFGMPTDQFALWFFHFVFAATCATIVSGALAERCHFTAYLAYSVALTGFIYPVVTHWAWNENGWLSQGIEFTHDNITETVVYQDFAGSGVVHLLGGSAALSGAILLGPRLGRFDKETKFNFPGHSVPLAALGGFILFFGFFAFNGGSQLSISNPGDGVAMSRAVVNTMISGGFAGVTSLIIRRLGHYATKNPPRWSLLVSINGGICGMVAICAGCNAVHSWGAALIGTVAGMNYILWSFLVEKARVDDPLDAVAVHAGAGLWGVLAAPVLDKDVGIVYSFSKVSFVRLGWNLVGALAIMSWGLATCLILFGGLRLIGVLRVSEDIERRGLDIPKHGEAAYPIHSYGDGWTVQPYEADTLIVEQGLAKIIKGMNGTVATDVVSPPPHVEVPATTHM